ncbi:hypothetical protein CBS9595_003282 [Malassezia furfur]|nr:hypothetical protein CBS9595_003282 [Malassezia furfur]
MGKLNAPSLRQFMLHAEALALYRKYLRATRSRRETIAWFRDEFEQARHETDVGKIESLLKHGRIQLKQTESGMMLSSTSGSYAPLRGGRG